MIETATPLAFNKNTSDDAIFPGKQKRNKQCENTYKVFVDPTEIKDYQYFTIDKKPKKGEMHDAASLINVLRIFLIGFLKKAAGEMH